MSEVINKAVEHIMAPSKPMISNTITYKWKSTAGTSMHIHVGVDEYGAVNSMILNVGSSGTTVHNLANTLGRVISIAIQEGGAKTALKIVHTMEDVTSEVDWMHEGMGRAKSIPNVIASILERHIHIEGVLEDIHTGDESDGEADV